jgi:cell division protein FtsW (lipid II flippase)
MTVRADHVSGLAFMGIGALIIGLSGDLSFGSLSFPGSGFLPTILASLLMMLGAALMLRARESEPVSSIRWEDLRHAGSVIAICALATVAYRQLGFVITFTATMLALLLLVERRNVLPALLYSVFVTAFTFVVFHFALKAPLPTGQLGF